MENVAERAEDEEVADVARDSGSSSDSDFEELDISPEDTKLLLKLEQQLKDNPGLYDSHVQFIEVLRRCKMSSRLHEARQAMHAALPLTEALWFDWLSDEIEGVAGAEDVPKLEALMEAAVGDYLCIPLWVQYLEFAPDFDPRVAAGGTEARDKMRGLCERALTAGGLHVTEGSRLWAVYRGYEQGLLEAGPSEEQAERVRSLWMRQLQVPLADGPDTLDAYMAWERGIAGNEGWQVPQVLAAGYDKAQQAAELRQPYEESVAAGKQANADLLAAYMAYIKVEERAGNPSRVQVVYERALAAFPVTHFLWLQYTRYLEAHLKIHSVVNAAYARAVRNCPWVGQLWGRALRALELSGAPDERHAALYEKALVAGLQSYEGYLEVVLARLDCLRRRGSEMLPALRDAFQAAADLLHSYFPDHLDRTFRLTSYWADCEAGLGGNIKAARAVWEAALKGAAGRYADTWAAYIDFEQQRGCTREARTLYKRCYSRRLEEGGQAMLCEAWLRFEREKGSAEDHLAACLKVDPILQELQAAAAAATDPQQHAAAQSAVARAPQLSREEMKAMRQQADPNYAAKRKRRGGEGECSDVLPAAVAAAAAKSEMPPPPAKKPRTAAVAAAGSSPEQLAQQQPVVPVAATGPQQQEEQVQAGEEVWQEQRRQQQQQQQQQKPGSLGWRQQRRTGANTVFVKHLTEGVEEGALRELFGGCGPIVGIEMGREKHTGRLKGFAYIHFASHKSLEAACRMDRAEFRGKHIFVAASRLPATDGQQAPQQVQQAQQGGGRGGRDGGRGRGGRDGGRGGFGGRDGGRGHGSSKDGGRNGGIPPGPKHHSTIDLGSVEPSSSAAGRPVAPLLGFVPRSAVLQGKGGCVAAQAPDAGADKAPKSNEEFRKLFLKK